MQPITRVFLLSIQMRTKRLASDDPVRMAGRGRLPERELIGGKQALDVGEHVGGA